MIWHRLCNLPGMAPELFGRSDQGRNIMTITNTAQKALASVTALFASFVLISAAIGPVLPIA